MDDALKPFEIIESTVINNQINKIIDETSNFTCLSKGDCSLLLRYFKWNTNKMNEVYFDDPEQYLTKAGINPNPIENEITDYCDICYEQNTDNIGLSCAHYFCKSCWKKYITEVLKKGFSSINSLCMQSGCNCKIHYEIIENVDQFLLSKYWKLIKKEYVESQGNVFCPNDKCGRAINIIVNDRKNENIVCLCGQRFCFQCLTEFHSPASCKQVSDWNTLSTTDDEESYLLLTAKACYHCGLLCEKTSGCNHMTCPKCHKEWCWMCREPWDTHGTGTGGFYSCNKYKEGSTLGNEIDNKAKQKKQFYESYKFHFDRWMNHQSLNKQTILKKDEIENELFLHYKNQSRAITRILDSFDVLILARCWLKFSYVFSFYSNVTTGLTELFNHQQSQIESITENLGELLFKPVSTYNEEIISNKASTLKKVIDHFS